MENIDFIIEFDKYCDTCEHKDLDEIFDPCHECLSNPTCVNSHKPLKYEANEKLVKEKEKKNQVKEG